MAYIKFLSVPLKCPRCGVTRVATGMGQHTSLRDSLDGEQPIMTYADICPDCGDRMEIDERLKDL
jgi:ribosomal protein S27AE